MLEAGSIGLTTKGRDDIEAENRIFPVRYIFRQYSSSVHS